MAIKKKPIKKQTVTTKKPVKKSKPTVNDTNRGRPEKEFKLKKKRTNISLTPTINEIPQSHKIGTYTERNRSILYLFVFSVVLFIFSIGLSIVKKDKLKQFDITTTGQETSQVRQEEPVKEVDLSQTISAFYEAISSKNFDAMNAMVDSTLKNGNTFRTYFNTKRLTRFVDSLTDTKITVSDIKEIPNDNQNIKNFTLSLSYTLTTDSKTYTENRSMTLTKKGEEYKIAKIMCDTTGCSRMPFFNPGKYNIK